LRAKLIDDKLPVVSVAGEVDHYNSPSIKAVLDEAVGKGSDMIIDLSEVVYMDTAGIGLLFATVKSLLRVERQLGLVLGDDNVKYIVTIVGLTKISNLQIFETLEEAINAMGDCAT